MVDRAFVRRYFPNTDPLTGSFAYGYPTVNRKTMSRIVGVVADARYKSLAEAAEPTFYMSQDQTAFPFLRTSVVVAPGGDRANSFASIVSDISAELKRFDPQIVVTATTAQAIVDETLTRQQLGVTLMLIFGATALMLMRSEFTASLRTGQPSAAVRLPRVRRSARRAVRSSG